MLARTRASVAERWRSWRRRPQGLIARAQGDLARLRPHTARLALAAALASVPVILVVVWKLPEQMAPDTGPAVTVLDRANSIDAARRTVAQIVAGLVVLVVGSFTAWLTARRVVALEQQVSLGERTLETERFSRSIEQLGATRPNGDPATEIRAGGIYSLGRIASEAPEFRRTVIETLAGYLRAHSPAPVVEPDLDDLAFEALNETVASSMDVVAARSIFERLVGELDDDEHVALDLEDAAFPGLTLGPKNLDGASLRGAFLPGATLSGTKFGSADLRGVVLRAATITAGASLDGADLSGGDLRGAFFNHSSATRAKFAAAALQRLQVSDANLGGADYSGADLEGGGFARVNLMDTDFAGANLTEVGFGYVGLHSARLAEALLVDATFYETSYDERTTWPDGFTPPASAE